MRCAKRVSLLVLAICTDAPHVVVTVALLQAPAGARDPNDARSLLLRRAGAPQPHREVARSMRVRCVRGLGPIRIRGSDEVTRSRSITSLGALLYDQGGKLDEAQRATLGDWHPHYLCALSRECSLRRRRPYSYTIELSRVISTVLSPTITTEVIIT